MSSSVADPSSHEAENCSNPTCRWSPRRVAAQSGPFGWRAPRGAVAFPGIAPEGELTVLFARTADSTGVVIGLLSGSIPFLLLVVAGTTWRVVGRALAPVESITE